VSSTKRSATAAANLLAKGALSSDDIGRGVASFAAVGIAAALTYMVLTYCLAMWLGVGSVPASTLGYLAGVVVSYVGQSQLTFRAGWSRQAVAKFAVVSLLGFACSVGLMHLLHEVWFCPVIYPIVLASLLVPALSFLAMNFYVFIARK
jgi:putative flippase GtrA